MQKKLFRLLVVGSRSINDYNFVQERLDYFLSKIREEYEIEIVSGGAKGVDALAERYAKEKGYELKVFPADWNTYGNRAGYIRNEEMHRYIAELENRGVVAFWDGKSKGTLHSKELAKKYKNPIRWVRKD